MARCEGVTQEPLAWSPQKISNSNEHLKSVCKLREEDVQKQRDPKTNIRAVFSFYSGWT